MSGRSAQLFLYQHSCYYQLFHPSMFTNEPHGRGSLRASTCQNGSLMELQKQFQNGFLFDIHVHLSNYLVELKAIKYGGFNMC